MRRTGYVAAAAAGMIVPLAIALPAFASAPSPAFAGVSSILQNDGDGDWDDNGYYDGNGDGIDDDHNDDNGHDNGDNDPYDDLDEIEENADLDVEASASTVTGDVSIVVSGDDYPDFEDIIVTSPSLVDNCESTDLDSVNAETDRYGEFNLALSATECEVGTYQIIVTEEDEYTSKIVNVDID
ncbi:MAG: hypothetical protein ACRDTC_00350 [Pseudonocardiaceae bacterium]